jgi:endonuclease YncB( thermonuclease family)
MKELILLIAMLSQPPTGSELTIPGKVIGVRDGDTITVEFKFQMNVRLLNCYAPELNTEDGKKAQKFLEDKINKNKEVQIQIPFTNKINKSISLSRFLANVYQDIDGDGIMDNLSEIMVKSGLAKEKK